MSINQNERQQSELKNALEQCELVSENAYKESLRYIKLVESGVRQACSSIENCKKEMLKSRINDAQLIESVQKQLISVQNIFQSSVDKTKKEIEYKRNSLNKFNVTLFGKTMAGKSTLMEILTHGNGASIGKGGQRTTQDVRSYEWNGLKVTDVPGIEAFDGQADDANAENAATYADLILFMITAGQPESAEADWLVKLKRKDKPILCICNYKSSLSDERRMRRFLMHPERIEQEMNVDGLVDQFNEFVADKLPNERVLFIVTHLLAKYCSMHLDPPDEEKSKLLSKISNFEAVEKAITKEIISNGVLYREKCYLSIVDNPLYDQMRQLFDFSTMALYQYNTITDKMNQFETWAKDFNQSDFADLRNKIDNIFYRAKNTIAGFVEDNLERRDLDELWKRHLEKMKIEDEIKRVVQKHYTKAEDYVKSLFEDLGTELKLVFKFNEDGLGSYSVTNWKRGFGWASSIVGVAGVIATLVLELSNPIGWIIGGVSLVLALFGIFSDSREKKLREQRNKLTTKLRDSLNEMQSKIQQSVAGKIHDDIENGLQETARRKLHMLKKSMQALANTERELATGYCRNHAEISLALVKSIAKSSEKYQHYSKYIQKAARIPSKYTVMVVEKFDESVEDFKKYVSGKIGCNERVWALTLNLNQTRYNIALDLIKELKINIKPQIRGDYAYIPKQNYSEDVKDNLNIVEQIAGIHLIQRG